MGLFSSSKSARTTNNTNQSSGFSEVSGAVNSVNASNSEVFMTTTDRGAVRDAFTFSEATSDKAFQFGGKALDHSRETTRDAFDLTKYSLGSVLDFARGANNEAQDAVRENVNKFTNEFASFANRQTASEADKISELAKWGGGAVLAYLAFNAYMRGKS